MNYEFNEKEKTKGLISIKELNKSIELIIKTNKIIRNKNNLLIDYDIDNNNFIYEIEEIK